MYDIYPIQGLFHLETGDGKLETQTFRKQNILNRECLNATKPRGKKQCPDSPEISEIFRGLCSAFTILPTQHCFAHVHIA